MTLLLKVPYYCHPLYLVMSCFKFYRSGTVNSNTVNSKFHLIRSYYEIFFYHFRNISCLKCTVNSNFHLIRNKTLLTNDFELTVPNLYIASNKYHTLLVLCESSEMGHHRLCQTLPFSLNLFWGL